MYATYERTWVLNFGSVDQSQRKYDCADYPGLGHSTIGGFVHYITYINAGNKACYAQNATATAVVRLRCMYDVHRNQQKQNKFCDNKYASQDKR